MEMKEKQRLIAIQAKRFAYLARMSYLCDLDQEDMESVPWLNPQMQEVDEPRVVVRLAQNAMVQCLRDRTKCRDYESWCEIRKKGVEWGRRREKGDRWEEYIWMKEVLRWLWVRYPRLARAVSLRMRGYKWEEVARELGVHVKTVEYWRRRVRKKVRKRCGIEN